MREKFFTERFRFFFVIIISKTWWNLEKLPSRYYEMNTQRTTWCNAKRTQRLNWTPLQLKWDLYDSSWTHTTKPRPIRLDQSWYDVGKRNPYDWRDSQSRSKDDWCNELKSFVCTVISYFFNIIWGREWKSCAGNNPFSVNNAYGRDLGFNGKFLFILIYITKASRLRTNEFNSKDLRSNDTTLLYSVLRRRLQKTFFSTVSNQ
jgi:hypothetical protein